MLRVDSPGGSVLASEQIYRELVALRAAGKPLVVSMGGYAASGGYYISAPADEIWASPATITGSIGIFAIIPTIDKTLGKVGVSVDGVGTTALSGQARIDRPLSEGARAVLQARHHAWLRRVRRARRQRPQARRTEQVDTIAQGRVWAGADAQARRAGRPARLVQRCGEGGGAARQAHRLLDQVHRAEAHLGADAGDEPEVEPRAGVPARRAPTRRRSRSLAQRLDPVTHAGALLESLQRAEPPVRVLLLRGALNGSEYARGDAQSLQVMKVRTPQRIGVGRIEVLGRQVRP